MMFFNIVFILFCGTLFNAEYLSSKELDSCYLNASIDASLTISIYMKSNLQSNTQSSVTGFGIYFTSDSSLTEEEYNKWNKIEILSSQDDYHLKINGEKYNIHQDTVYRILATVFNNHVEGSPSEAIHLDTREAAGSKPIIQSTNVLPNSSVVIEFVSTDNVENNLNYTAEYQDITDDASNSWQTQLFSCVSTHKVILTGLRPNRTYKARLFATGNVVQGVPSEEVVFNTNHTSELPKLYVEPHWNISFDPNIAAPFEVKCIARSRPISHIKWLVNGVEVNSDNGFYATSSKRRDQEVVSVIHAKSRTRSDNLTCVATNAAGSVAQKVFITIRGPGSPPANLELNPERGAFVIKWEPPPHSNGQIRKYVVYHSLNKDEPLSDWNKLDLDGSERSVKVFASNSDVFYARVQAATEQGPGIISDLIAIEKNTIPISISLNLLELKYNSSGTYVLDPSENVSVYCNATGKPQPFLHFALTDNTDPRSILNDVWQPLHVRLKNNIVTSLIQISLISSKILHCRAKNSAGANYSSITLRVNKPGDAPANLRVLSVSSGDVVLVWDAPQYPNLPVQFYEVILTDFSSEERLVFNSSNTTPPAITRISLPSTNLRPSHTYSIQVRAVNAAGAGPLSESVQFTTLNGGPETVPNNLSIEIDEANSAILIWDLPNSTSTLTHYVIYYTKDLGTPDSDYENWQNVKIPAGTINRQKLDYSLGFKPKTFYRVRLSAANELANGPVSETLEFETAASVLPIPTDVQASVDEDNSVHLSFEAVRDPDDHSKAIQSYKLEISESESIVSAEWDEIEAKFIMLDDSSLKSELVVNGSKLSTNKMYWLRVTAQLDNPTRLVQSSKPIRIKTGRGKLKTRASIKEGDLLETEPDVSTPFVLNCLAEGSPAPAITWTWNNESIDKLSTIWTISEQVQGRQTQSKLQSEGTIESGLAVCHATNEEGNATASTQVRVLGPGSPPSEVNVLPYRNQLNVSWKPPKFPNGDIQKYLVYYTVNVDDDLGDWNKIEVSGWVHNISVDALDEEALHGIRVQAVSQHGPGIISGPAYCKSQANYEALSIWLSFDDLTDNVAEPNQTIKFRCHGKGLPVPSISCSWADEKEPIEISYLDSDMETKEFSSTFYVSTLVSRTVYCRAVNKYEEVTTNSTIIVRRPADTPSFVRWSFDDEGRLFIDWDLVKYPNGNESYHIYLSQSDVTVHRPPVLWAKDEIPLNVNLSLRIAAVNEWLEGKKSEEIMVPTLNGGPRDAPSILAVEVMNTTVCFEWAPPTKPFGEITRYRLYFEENEKKEQDWTIIEIGGNNTEYCLDEKEGLRIESRYKMKISAENEVHEGPPSTLHFFDTCILKLEAPYNISAVLKNTSLVVYLPPGHSYENFAIYVRQKSSEHYWKYEAVDINPAEQVITVNDFPLDKNASYRMKVAGVVNGRESDHSEEFDLSIEEALSDTTLDNNLDKRRILKEPPL